MADRIPVLAVICSCSAGAIAKPVLASACRPGDFLLPFHHGHCSGNKKGASTPQLLPDSIFGRDCFLNDVIWAYDYGARTKQRWPPKHDNILVYLKDRTNYVFNADEIERIPYMARGLVGPEKAARGKLPTDTWWRTIVPTNGKEKTGYPTQKPLGILRRILTASSRPGDLVLDFFAGSGTTGAAAIEQDRRFILIDNNVEAMKVMARRFGGQPDVEFIGFLPSSAPDPAVECRLPKPTSPHAGQ